jgi:hypothetical protein
MRSSQSFLSSRCEQSLLLRRKVHYHVTYFLLCFSLVLLSHHVCGGSLRKVRSDISDIGYPRGDFHPLKCNNKLDEDPCLTPWSKLFGSRLDFSEMVEIPCGKCVVMHPMKSPLTFSGGLKVLGKLVIYANDIVTTSILVHGELVIESTKPIDGQADVSITWIDSPSNQTLSFRVPENEDGSNDICGGERGACGMGRKPFVVAGGILDIRGLPSPFMPTWVPLYDVDTSAGISSSSVASVPTAMQGMYQYQPPKLGCPEDEILIDHSAMTSSISSEVLVGSYGSISEWTSNGGLKITNRTHSQHCPVVDLKHVGHCLQAGKTYLLTAKVLLTQNGKVDQSDCARGDDDTGCMSIYQLRMSERGIGRTRSLWKESQSFGSMIGEETTIAIDFNFTSSQISEFNIYEMIQLRGPGPGVDMELLEFTLRAPPKEAFPEPENLCKDLVPTNGDAELLGLSPYPFRSNNDQTLLSVVSEGSNHYFEVTGREFAVQKARRGKNWRNAGISWDVLPYCMKNHMTYTFHAEVRMHALSLASSEWKMKAYVKGIKKPVFKTLAKCPKSQGTWVSCDGKFEPSVDIIEADRFEVYLESDTSSFDVDYDVDNVSFKLTESGLDVLILPKSVENLWSVGSEILITSHTSKWDGHSTRRIISLENHDEEGYVRVGLNEAIDRPLTLGSHPFHATEVALLSRNIIFNGAGGAHLTILKTPDQIQVLQGVEFLGFGEENVPNSYPIHFDSCNDISNSIVSRNTIRESNQRCVVLDETNNVIVEENIAFGNKGHCFVVETGTEVGNVFRSNLAAFCRRAQTIVETSDYEEETDDALAAFWIGAPSNHWIGNVASGSEGFGFWFQPQGEHRHEGTQGTSFVESPYLMPLNEFTNNVVHSSNEESLKITGYNPTETASIKKFKSYLINKGHIQVSGSSNIDASETLLDSELASTPFHMSGTTIVAVQKEDENSIGNTKQDDHFYQSATNPTDVFNLQSSPSLLE